MYKTSMRVYYEDTDAGGVVYYANYLKFAERARTEMLRDSGISQQELWEREGIGFAVRHCVADYKKPARLDDLLTIETEVAETGKASITMQQRIKRSEELLVTLSVRLACIDNNFRPAALPESVRQALAA